MDVRFSDERLIMRAVSDCIRKTLYDQEMIIRQSLNPPEKPAVKQEKPVKYKNPEPFERQTIMRQANKQEMIRETSGELQYVLLDYEWVFPEELDRRFVRWRILSYWYEAHRQALYAYADRQAYLSCFGIAPEELPGFEEKEAAFQELVRGGEDLTEKYPVDEPQIIGEENQKAFIRLFNKLYGKTEDQKQMF